MEIKEPQRRVEVVLNGTAFKTELRGFRGFETDTQEFELETAEGAVPVFVNEFWTAKQRAAHSLHEISYRACFKPQLPRFFIERLTQPGDLVYDPFMGRGTTLIEAALLGRKGAGCDVNPLSLRLARPRLDPPGEEATAARLEAIELGFAGDMPEELLAFYHPETLRAICGLRGYLLRREASGELDGIDAWIRLVALNRLTGHSPGFLSVYTLPPNQAVSVKSQVKINAQREQTPPLRDLRRIILKKSKALLKDGLPEEFLRASREDTLLLAKTADNTPELADGSVALVVTSPPFLDVIQYEADNWLRCWFCGIDAKGVAITMCKKIEDWREAMTEVMKELARVVRVGGWIAFEVGEVRGGSVRLEEEVVPCGVAAGLRPELIMINAQAFTKTSNCWGVDNLSKGTNTNRIVVFRKP